MGPLPQCGAPISTHTAWHGPGKVWTHQQLRSKIRRRRVGSPSIACRGSGGVSGQRRAEGGPAGSGLEWQPPGARAGCRTEPRSQARKEEELSQGQGQEGRKSPWGAPRLLSPFLHARTAPNPKLPPYRDPCTQTTHATLHAVAGDTGGPGVGYRAQPLCLSVSCVSGWAFILVSKWSCKARAWDIVTHLPTRETQGSFSAPQTPAEPAAPQQPERSAGSASPLPEPREIVQFPA